MAVRVYNMSEVKADLYNRITTDGEYELLLGEFAKGDSLPSWWQYIASATDVDDFENGVICPTLQTGDGRWIRQNTAMTLDVATANGDALQAQIDGKYSIPTGTSTDYIAGDGSIMAFPSIPAAQTNSDWNATSGVAQILNKPSIPTIPGSLPPSGNAGGDLAGTYPNPTIANGTITTAKVSSIDYSKISNAPTNVSSFANDAGYIAGINSSAVTAALGFTPVSQLGARAAISLTTTGSGSATYNSTTGALNIPTPVIPASKRQETYSGTTNVNGIYTITYGTAYSVTPNVQFQINGGTNKTTILLTSSTTTGCSFYVQVRADVLGLLPTYSNVSGAAVDVLVTEK